MSWIPTNATLFDVKDSDSSGRYTIAYQPLSNETVLHYQWEISPAAPAHFIVKESQSGLDISLKSLDTLFVPNGIKYRLNDQIKQVPHWEQVPSGADLVDFSPTSVRSRAFQLQVTVNIEQVDVLTATKTQRKELQAWSMIVHHDYSSGKTQLEEYLHAGSYT